MPESQGLFSLKKQICPLLQIVLGALRVKHFLMCLCACAHKPLHVFIYMAATYQRHWARQPPQVLQICANL